MKSFPKAQAETDSRYRGHTRQRINQMKFTVELDQEEDGRWIAEVIDIPGALAYGQSQQEALAKVEALALRVIADRLEHGEIAADLVSVTFAAA
jgi:predicted RNase H-like HicB family nuclease